MDTSSVLRYIDENWEQATYRDAPGEGFKSVDLPHPYTSPCIKGKGKFYFFFYWDSYFTNLGLLAQERFDTARDNIRNMLWLIRRQGYMPNHVAIYNRSQPPYLCRMVGDYLEATGDEELLREAADALRQEYFFWTLARHTPAGLSRHGHHDTEEGCEAFFGIKRIQTLLPQQTRPKEEKIRIGGHFLAEAETGWDFNPRFEQRCLDFCPVDLNGLLYDCETRLAEWSRQLGWDDQPLWQERLAARKDRVDKLLWSEERGLYLDYDYVNQRPGKFASLAAFMPLFADLASPEQAAKVARNLPLFERERGLAVTADLPGCRAFQWAYPNMWPPLLWVAVEGLRRYGFRDDAQRLARKYLETSIALFERTGQLWEKTDAETGEVAGGEYDAAPMLGWSAGVFVACAALVGHDPLGHRKP